MMNSRHRSTRRPLVVLWSWAFVAALVTMGCGDPSDAKPCAPGEVEREGGQCVPKLCGPGEITLAPGACQPAGLPPDMPCPPGEHALGDGRCQPAGVPPEACGEGFVADGRGGCAAILPKDECPEGQMAILGKTSCDEVAPCGDGVWGDIPVEASTQFVDQAYAGDDSDGTTARPWTTLQQAINEADGGAIVAVAAGRYVEDVTITDKAVRLWGRCPGRVEIQGAGEEEAAIRVLRMTASGTEIRGLAVTGATRGIAILSASDVTIDKVWVHEAAADGILVDGSGGKTSTAIKASLVEGNHGAGVAVLTSDNTTIEGTVIRGTRPTDDMPGVGLAAETRADVAVRACLIEKNSAAGVFVNSSNATIEASVIRGLQADSEVELGRGIEVQSASAPGVRARVTVRASLVEDNRDIGVLISGSDATLEATVVRSTRPRADGTRGRGIEVQYDGNTKMRADATVHASLIEQNHEAGVFVAGSEAKIVASVVRATQPNPSGKFGRGIEADPMGGERAGLTIHACIVEQNYDVGIFVIGSVAEIDATRVHAFQSTAMVTEAANPDAGMGIRIQDDPGERGRAEVTIRACLVEQNKTAGVVVVASDATIETTVVRATQPSADGSRGRGISAESRSSTREPAKVIIRACLVEQNHEFGVSVIASDAMLDGALVRETKVFGHSTFGHGVAIADGGAADIHNTRITNNKIVGVASINSTVNIVDTTLACNGLDLTAWPYDTGSDAPFYSDGWRCTRHGAEDCNETDGDCFVNPYSFEAPSSVGLSPGLQKD
ncbi:right-handed parallel beta-helix repeat-containing protein [Sorangium sp. So ce134]